MKQLRYNTHTYTEPTDIANAVADYFAADSSDVNYSQTFVSNKLHSESLSINFPPDTSYLPYNYPISHYEITHAIHHSFKNSSPGPDRIHPAMLKHLHPKSIDYLNLLFNEIFISESFPSQWKKAIVIPILKPDSDSSEPKSYRPISLTSVLGKLLEKILNKRLIWYLESNRIFTDSQYGFRKNRSILQAIQKQPLNSKNPTRIFGL